MPQAMTNIRSACTTLVCRVEAKSHVIPPRETPSGSDIMMAEEENDLDSAAKAQAILARFQSVGRARMMSADEHIVDSTSSKPSSLKQTRAKSVGSDRMMPPDELSVDSTSSKSSSSKYKA
jgi:hypothetical protein